MKNYPNEFDQEQKNKLLSMCYRELHEDINPENTESAANMILYENLFDEPRVDHIVLSICSPGGDLDSANILIDTIRNSRIPVVTVARGEVASAAVDILMAGHYRYANKDTIFLSHQYSIYSSGTSIQKQSDILASQKSHELRAKNRLAYYVERTGLKEAEVKKKLLKEYDVWLTAEEALELKVFDELTPPCLIQDLVAANMESLIAWETALDEKADEKELLVEQDEPEKSKESA